MVYIYSKTTPNNGVLWAKCNDFSGLFGLNSCIQYFLDNIKGLNDFWVMDDNGYKMSFLKVAFICRFRKRNPQERNKNIITGDAEKVFKIV